jgi:hypothetical protein
MTALEILTSKLIGSSIAGFSIGDWWDLSFGGYHIVTQNVILEDEDALGQLANNTFSWFKKSVDKENIGKCAIVTACMRREVIGVEINKSCDLVVKFHDGLKLTIPTDTSIVDLAMVLEQDRQDSV